MLAFSWRVRSFGAFSDGLPGGRAGDKSGERRGKRDTRLEREVTLGTRPMRVVVSASLNAERRVCNAGSPSSVF